MKKFFSSLGLVALVVVILGIIAVSSYKFGYDDAINIATIAATEVVHEQQAECASAIKHVISKTCPGLREDLINEFKK